MIRILIFLFLAFPAFAAITEKYVSALAIGGGSGTIGSPYTFTEMVTEINLGSAAGIRYNVKADGTYSRIASDTISGSGSSTSPVIIRGYLTSIGDAYLGRTNGNGALITTNLPLVAYVSTFRLTTSGSWIILESLRFTSTVAGPTVTASPDGAIVDCSISNASNGSGAAAITHAVRTVIMNNDCFLTGGTTATAGIICSGGTSSRVLANRISSTSIGITVTGTNGTVIANNTIYGGTVPISTTATGANPTIINNTLVGGSGDGVDIVTGTTVLQCITGNMITDNGGYGIDLNNAAVASFGAYNRFRGNTIGTINLGTDWTTATNYGVVTSATLDYVSPGLPNFNYNLLSTSPAKAASIPAYSSIGALQPQATSGGETSFTFGN